MRSGAWKCLFFLAQELIPKKITEIQVPVYGSLEKLSEVNGWHAEYHLIESFVLDLQSGKSVDINRVIEKVIADTSNKVESTLLIATDENCGMHIPLPKGPSDKRMKELLNQPENEERLKVLVGTPPYGILLMDNYLETDLWLKNCQEATIVDILRVHEYSYIKSMIDSCAKASEDEESEGKASDKILDYIINVDRDTLISPKSYTVAAKSAGVVISAVDAVMKNKCRGAFCAIRPPGHHAGPWGAVETPEARDMTGLGFCILNNVAIGAAYTLYNYRSAIR